MSTTSSEPASSARERLIESHLPLVRSVARRYAGRGESLDDLVQVGAIGLIKASDRFDESRGVAFATFATPAIEGEIRRHLRDRVSALRIPRELQHMNAELREHREKLTSALGRSPTVQELAAALGVDEHDIERALSAERARDSIPLSSGSDSVDLPDASDRESGSDERLLLARSVRALDERERQIVFLRFHADMTEKKIGRELGISQAHVSRLLSGALAKLRAELASSDDPAAGDTTAGGVISPDSEGMRPSQELRKRDRPRTTMRNRRARIGRVGALDENRTLARYLELPYNVAVRSEHEGQRSEWSATIEELPGCTARGSTPDEAVDRLRPAMEAWLTVALADQREIPVPAGEAAKQKTASSHSGRFLVRMPGALHEQLAAAAEREQVSLNRFVTDVLAASVSSAPLAEPPSAVAEPPDETIEPVESFPREPPRAFRVALATNLAVVVLAGLVAVVLLVLALERGI